jgi:hypothetical protein
LICLSFDTDRMSRRAMDEFLAGTPVPGEATFFCTQRYSRLEATPHEVCPHVFLTGETDWDRTLDEARRDFPEAIGWRSHSCVFSHILAERLSALGYEYVSIHDELGKSDLAPHRHAWGLWHLPIYYMDNLDFSMHRFWGDRAPAPFDPRLIETAVEGAALFVFAFHPIHLQLNSPSPEVYFERRELVARGESFASARWDGFGTRNFYDALCAAMEAAGEPSVRLDRALETYRSREMAATTQPN